MKYKRVLLKLSGESLGDKSGSGLDKKALLQACKGIFDLHKKGIEVAVVIGGGNIFRGNEGAALDFDRVAADQMGMLATIMNGIALRETLRSLDIEAEVLTSFETTVVPKFSKEKACMMLSHGIVAIFAGGTGNPFFTTDTAAALRAAEIGADVVMKATKVDGVYSKDPLKHKDAVRFAKIAYSDALQKKLAVMDATAFALSMESGIPTIVFSMQQPKFSKVLEDSKLGTLLHI